MPEYLAEFGVGVDLPIQDGRFLLILRLKMTFLVYLTFSLHLKHSVFHDSIFLIVTKA